MPLFSGDSDGVAGGKKPVLLPDNKAGVNSPGTGGGLQQARLVEGTGFPRELTAVK